MAVMVLIFRLQAKSEINFVLDGQADSTNPPGDIIIRRALDQKKYWEFVTAGVDANRMKLQGYNVITDQNTISFDPTDGSAEFAGDVAIGDSDTFFGTIGDAVALLPNSIVDQFKTVIDGLPKTQPYDATTLPADLPTPLKDALVRVTTAGKINLNSDGSAGFAGVIKPDAVVSTRGV